MPGPLKRPTPGAAGETIHDEKTNIGPPLASGEAFLDIKWEGNRISARARATGTVIGRDPNCQVKLTGHAVSRRHARVYRDSLGRWLLEDLGSRFGTTVNGRAVRSHWLGAEDEVRIGPYSLRLRVPPAEGSSLPADTTLVETDDDALTQSTELVQAAPQAELERFNRVLEDISRVASVSQMYPAVCHAVARHLECQCLVVRAVASGNAGELAAGPGQVHVLASAAPEGGEGDLAGIRLSRTVLTAAQSAARAVLGRAAPLRTEDVQLSVVTEGMAAAVAAPLPSASMESYLLYVALPSRAKAEYALEFVQAVALFAGRLLQALHLSDESARRQTIQRQMELATKIQRRLLPPEAMSFPAAEAAVHYQPALCVGGDFCDVWPLADGAVGLTVGDVSGKGLPAAILASHIHAALRAAMSIHSRLGEAIRRVQEWVAPHIEEGMFATLILARYQPDAGRLELVNMGHPSSVLWAFGRKARTLDTPRVPPLGVEDGEPSVPVTTIDLPPESGLLLFSDGITEAMSPADELFGDTRVLTALSDARLTGAQSAVRAVTEAVDAFQEWMPQQDDRTVVALLHRS